MAWMPRSSGLVGQAENQPGMPVRIGTRKAACRIASVTERILKGIIRDLKKARKLARWIRRKSTPSF